MIFSKDLIDKFAPEADCIPAMKIWKIPENKENKFSEICNSGEYFAELKKDGYWYQYEKTTNYQYLFSRNISTTTGILTEKIANVPHIQKALSCLPSGTILIGEIYYPGKTSKDVTKIMGCLPEEAIKRQNNQGLIHYYLHDVIKYNNIDIQSEGAWNRYQVLKAIWDKFNLKQYDFLELAEVITDNIQEATAEALQNGEEGMVLKKKTYPYAPDKRPAWSTIKIKKMDYIDAICIGFCDATKEYTGKLDLHSNYQGKDAKEWPYWCIFKEDLFSKQLSFESKVPVGKTEVIKGINYKTLPVTKGYYYGWKTAIRIGALDKNGKIVEIGTVASGLTDELRADFAKNPETYLNKIVSLQCMEKDSKEHTLRHGFFKGFRDDKNFKDCTLDTIF